VPKLGETSGPRKKKAEVKKREISLNLVDLADMPGGGYTIAACGRPQTGKTDSFLTMGYINNTFADKYKERYPVLYQNLRDGEIPEVERIIVIESENAIGKQTKRKYEKRLLGPMREVIPIKVYSVPVVSQKELQAASGEWDVDPESVEDIMTASDIYMESLKEVMRDYGSETMILLDSASRFKKLLDSKAQIIYNQKVKNKGEDTVKNEGFNKWGSRNMWWDAAMTMLRGAPGWVGATFMVVDNPDWVPKLQKKKGLTPEYTKTIWTKDTGFNFDVVYDFELQLDSTVNVVTRVGRYMGRGEENQHLNEFPLGMSDRLSFLQGIENMLTIIEGSQFDDW